MKRLRAEREAHLNVANGGGHGSEKRASPFESVYDGLGLRVVHAPERKV
jgi:hypothetical protein